MAREKLIEKLAVPKDNQVYLTNEEVYYILGDWIKQHFSVDTEVSTVKSFDVPHIKVTIKK